MGHPGRWIALALVAGGLLAPAAAVGQGRLGAGSYGPWGATAWSFLEVRVKCDGALPFTGNNPTAWRINFRNRAKEQASFDVVVTVAGSNDYGAPRRVAVKAEALREIQVELPTDCGGSIQTLIDKVRLGADAEGAEYVAPDRRPG